VKVVFKRWWSCSVHGECTAQAYSVCLGVEPLVRSRNIAPEAGGILISDAETKIETQKINSNKSQVKK